MNKKSFIEFLREQEKKNSEKAYDYASEYLRGLYSGYSDAFELCAMWLEKNDEIISKEDVVII